MMKVTLKIFCVLTISELDEFSFTFFDKYFSDKGASLTPCTAQHTSTGETSPRLDDDSVSKLSGELIVSSEHYVHSLGAHQLQPYHSLRKSPSFLDEQHA